MQDGAYECAGERTRHRRRGRRRRATGASGRACVFGARLGRSAGAEARLAPRGHATFFLSDAGHCNDDAARTLLPPRARRAAQQAVLTHGGGARNRACGRGAGLPHGVEPSVPQCVSGPQDAWRAAARRVAAVCRVRAAHTQQRNAACVASPASRALGLSSLVTTWDATDDSLPRLCWPPSVFRVAPSRAQAVRALLRAARRARARCARCDRALALLLGRAPWTPLAVRGDARAPAHRAGCGRGRPGDCAPPPGRVRRRRQLWQLDRD